MHSFSENRLKILHNRGEKIKSTDIISDLQAYREDRVNAFFLVYFAISKVLCIKCYYY